MGCLVLLVVLVVVLGAGSILALGFTIGLLFTFLVAGLVGWAADMIVPAGRLPGGWFGAVLTGLIGGLVGTWLFRALGVHDPGLSLFGVDVIPTFIGAVIVALAAQVFTSRRRVA